MSTPKHRLEKLCTTLWDSGRHAVWNEDADEWEIRKRDGEFDVQDIPKVVMIGVLRLPMFNKRYRQIQPDEVYQELVNGVDPGNIYFFNTNSYGFGSIANWTSKHLKCAIGGTINGKFANVFIVEESE